MNEEREQTTVQTAGIRPGRQMNQSHALIYCGVGSGFVGLVTSGFLRGSGTSMNQPGFCKRKPFAFASCLVANCLH